MAEETDNTQKPKAELIKRAPSSAATNAAENSDHESADGAVKTGSEPGERRKVIVVKKKPPAATSATATSAPAAPAAPAGTVKRVVQPKVVVNRGSPTEGEAVSDAVPAKGKADSETPDQRQARPSAAL